MPAPVIGNNANNVLTPDITIICRFIWGSARLEASTERFTPFLHRMLGRGAVCSSLTLDVNIC
jgi:hypothetical protein